MTNTASAYLRWRVDAPRESRVFPPLSPGHPAHDRPCPACGDRLGDDTPVQLLAIGPTDDDTRDRHRDGHWYTALALLFHASCLGATPPEVDA